jgi:hypothetical protein
MSKQADTTVVPTAPISLDDLRHKALAIREDVVGEAKSQIAERGTQIIVVGVVAALMVVSLAYLFGSRAGRRAAEYL